MTYLRPALMRGADLLQPARSPHTPYCNCTLSNGAVHARTHAPTHTHTHTLQTTPVMTITIMSRGSTVREVGLGCCFRSSDRWRRRAVGLLQISVSLNRIGLRWSFTQERRCYMDNTVRLSVEFERFLIITVKANVL